MITRKVPTSQRKEVLKDTLSHVTAWNCWSPRPEVLGVGKGSCAREGPEVRDLQCAGEMALGCLTLGSRRREASQGSF